MLSVTRAPETVRYLQGGILLTFDMKRLIIHSKSYEGKANSIIAEGLGLALSRMGYMVTVVSISSQASDSVSTYDLTPSFRRVLLPHYNNDLSAQGFLKRGLVLLEFYKELRADIIISMDPILPETFLPLAIGFLRRITTVSFVTDNWGIDPDRSRNTIEQLAQEIMLIGSIQLSKVQIYFSELVRNRLTKYRTKQALVIHGGFNDEEFSGIHALFDKAWFHSTFSIQDKNKVIFTSYDPRVKEIYIKLAKQIRIEGLKISLILVNNGPSPFESPDADELIDEGYLKFFGALERKQYIGAIMNSDILWISGPDSFWDKSRYPARLPEYMATGNPIVCSLGGTSKDFLLHSGYASISSYAFPTNYISSILHSFLFMLSSDSRIRAATTTAMKYAYEHLTWTKIAQNIVLFHSLLDKMK